MNILEFDKLNKIDSMFICRIYRWVLGFIGIFRVGCKNGLIFYIPDMFL